MKINLTALAASIMVTSLAVTDPAAGADLSALPSVEAQGPVNYITGGVGEDEAMALKQAAAKYAVELLFVQKATPRDEFLADVKVIIRDRSHAVVLDTVSKGPFLLANLPAGKYQVEADYDGVAKRQTVEIREGKHARAVFVWAMRDETNTPALSSADESR